MASTWTWTGQGDSEAIATDGWLGCYGASYGDTVAVGAYQSSTHVVTSTPADQCTSSHTKNCKYIDDTHVNDVVTTVSGFGTANVTLDLRYQTDGAVSYSIQNAHIRACQGTGALTTDPDDMTVKVFEGGVSTEWYDANIESTDAGMDLADKSSGNDHHWYIAVSISPDAAGDQSTNAILYVYLEYY